MNYSDRIEAVITLFEKGFTGAQVRELLNIPEPTLDLPGRNISEPIDAPTRVWDGSDYWNRNARGTWDCDVSMIGGVVEPTALYASWSWPDLTHNYPLWTDDTRDTPVDKDAWPA